MRTGELSAAHQSGRHRQIGGKEMDEMKLATFTLAALMVVAATITTVVPAAAGDLEVVIDHQGNVAVVDGSLRVEQSVRKLQGVVADQRQVQKALQVQIEEIKTATTDEALDAKIAALLQSRGVDAKTPAGQQAAGAIKSQAKAGTLDTESVQKMVDDINAANYKAENAMILAILAGVIALIALIVGLMALARNGSTRQVADRAEYNVNNVDRKVQVLAVATQRAFGDRSIEGFDWQPFPTRGMLFDKSRMADWLKQADEEEAAAAGRALEAAAAEAEAARVAEEADDTIEVELDEAEEEEQGERPAPPPSPPV